MTDRPTRQYNERSLPREGYADKTQLPAKAHLETSLS